MFDDVHWYHVTLHSITACSTVMELIAAVCNVYNWGMHAIDLIIKTCTPIYTYTSHTYIIFLYLCMIDDYIYIAKGYY